MMASIFDRFKREERAISFQTVWGMGGDMVLGNNSGTQVNAKTAFSLIPVYSAVSLISDTISTLPVDAYQRIDGDRKPYRPKPSWVDQPDVDQTRQGHYQSVLVSLLIWGNAYVRIFRNANGDVVNLVALDPQKMTVSRSAIGRKLFHYEGEDKALTSDDVMHLTDLLEPGAVVGMSRIERLREALGLGIALQDFAATFFGQGVTGSLVAEVPGNLTPDQARQLSDSMSNRHGGWRKSGRVPVLTGGATIKDISIQNDQSQFIESRRFFVEEVARLFNIPLHMMDVPGASSYSSIEQSGIQFVQHCLRPYIEKLEWSYSRLLPEQAFLKFNVDGLLRGDFNSRISAYATGLQSGFMSINDVRRIEDLSRVEGGDVYRVPLANVNLSASNLPEQEGKVSMAQKMIAIGFDPAEVLKALGLPPVAHTGVPSTQLQAVNTIDPENPASVYGV
jgi:HK97 family phage portal protein